MSKKMRGLLAAVFNKGGGEVNPATFKPKTNGISDKYSWNLYRFLKAHPSAKVYFYTKDWSGNHVDFDPNIIYSSYHYFIMFCDLMGARLQSIMQTGTNSRIETFAFNYWGRGNFIDVTDWFFREYERRGRCLFDQDHDFWWAGEKERYTRINSHSRRCNWCGKWQTRRIEKRVKIKRIEVWEAAK